MHSVTLYHNPMYGLSAVTRGSFGKRFKLICPETYMHNAHIPAKGMMYPFDSHFIGQNL